jgi:hypothetical protein
MSITSPEAAKKADYLSKEQLIPGCEFEYLVRAEKGPYGDFPDLQRAEYLRKRLDLLSHPRRLDRVSDPRTELRYQFQLNGHWVVRAAVLAIVDEGYKTMFNVYEDETVKAESIMSVSGVIMPRPIGPHLDPRHFGVHPVQEGFGMFLENPLINSRESKHGLRYVIPARNILKSSLRVVYSSAEPNGSD